MTIASSSMKNSVLFCMCALLMFEPTASRMTEKQLVAAVKLVRNMCTVKEKPNLADIDKMHQGDWDVDYKAQCYMSCALNSYKLMGKDNRLDREALNLQIETLLPESLRDYVVRCTDQCENAVTNLTDKCVAAYQFSKCVYFCDPEKYFLP
ncbi:general odorant-binding protein 72-like [Euwallacea fornicatus]|uniref:general odorant-binding protein 72-like n=1 Tax=Euwallacea fornicatus TaxID=995702 RepID=UPI00338F567B